MKFCSTEWLEHIPESLLGSSMHQKGSTERRIRFPLNKKAFPGASAGMRVTAATSPVIPCTAFPANSGPAEARTRGGKCTLTPASAARAQLYRWRRIRWLHLVDHLHQRGIADLEQQQCHLRVRHLPMHATSLEGLVPLRAACRRPVLDLQRRGHVPEHLQVRAPG